ncbi:MAG TPA: RNA polymerase sigma factor [Candidatus Saccharimonadales bacterium]|jgi:RNA polymerase sigma-70 factor (ECF subfamily)|nr:RNA polymerase sigma factor [Candidatus Saccharimonadales bacterium]
MKPHPSPAISVDTLQQLVAAAQAGESEAFGELYDLLYDRVYMYTFRRSYNSSAAQDITANTFYQMLTHLTKFRWHDEARFYGWVFRIAMHELSRYYREDNRYQTYEDWLSVADTIIDEHDSQHQTAEQAEQVIALRRSIADLPVKQREVVELYYFAGATHEVIAKTLRIRPGTARVRLHRALEALGQSLKGEGYAY